MMPSEMKGIDSINDNLMVESGHSLLEFDTRVLTSEEKERLKLNREKRKRIRQRQEQ